MRHSTTIIFDDDTDFNFDDLDFNLEEEAQQAEEATIEKPKANKPKANKPIVKEPTNSIGLTYEETETLLAILVGILFVTVMVGSLMGYTVWYFKQP